MKVVDSSRSLDVPGEPCAIFEYPHVPYSVVAPLAWLDRV